MANFSDKDLEAIRKGMEAAGKLAMSESSEEMAQSMAEKSKKGAKKESWVSKLKRKVGKVLKGPDETLRTKGVKGQIGSALTEKEKRELQGKK